MKEFGASNAMMSIFRMRPLVVAAGVLLAGVPCALDLSAQTAPPPIVVPQVPPRLNDPGPQLTIPQPGSPAQPPSAGGAGSRIAPQPSANSLHRPSSRHAASHRHVYRTHAGRKRHPVSGKKGACSYEKCIRRCCGRLQLRGIANGRFPYVIAVDPVRIHLVPAPGILPGGELQARSSFEPRRFVTLKCFDDIARLRDAA